MKNYPFYLIKTLLVGLVLCCSATVEGQDREDFFREFKVDSHNGKFGITFRDQVVEPFVYDAIEARDAMHGFITRQGDKYGIVSTSVFEISGRASKIDLGDSWKYVIKKQSGKDILLSANLIPCYYDSIDIKDGRYWVTFAGKKGVITSGGTVIVPCKYDGIESKDGRYWITFADKKGVITSGGTVIVPCKYDSIDIKDGRYWVSLAGKKGVITSGGTVVLPCKYDEIEVKNGRYIGHNI